MKEKETNGINLNEPAKTELEPSKEISKRNKKSLIIGLIVIIFLVLLTIYASIFLLKKPGDIFEQSISKAFSQLDKTVDKYVPNNINLEENDFSLNGNISFDTSRDLNEYEEFKNYALNFKADFSLTKKIMKIDLGLDKENNEFLKAMFIAQDDKLYAKIPEFLDKTLDIGSFDWNELLNIKKSNITKSSLKEVIDGTKKMFLEVIDKTKVQEEKNVEAFDKTNLTRISYVLDEEEQKEISAKCLAYLKNNEDYVNLLTSLFAIDKEELLDSLNDEYIYTQDVTVNIYTEGLFKTIIGAEIKSNNDFITTNNNKVTISTKDNEIVFEQAKNGFKIDIKVPKLEGTAEIEISNPSVNEENMKMKVVFNYNNETYKVNINLGTNYDTFVEKENINSLVKPDQLTMEEIQSLATKFFTKIEGTPFETLFTELFAGNV